MKVSVCEVKEIKRLEDLKDTPYEWWLEEFPEEELKRAVGCVVDVGDEEELEFSKKERFGVCDLAVNIDRYLTFISGVTVFKKNGKLYVRVEDIQP